EKLDTNHVVFAIHGQSSVTPYSAGAYVEGSATLKDKVAVTFATKELDSRNLTTFDKLKTAYDQKQALQKAIWEKVILVVGAIIIIVCLAGVLVFLKKLLSGNHYESKKA
ncbi:MAG: hypothetical protein ABH814_02235, partial [bacterium]